LGLLKAGTHTAATFQPALTFTVPDGWSNFEDTAGNFKLVPPGSTIVDWLVQTTDYVGVYASIGPDEPCAGPSLRLSGSAAMAAYLARQPALSTTPTRPVSVGRLSGVVLDIHLRKGWKTSCFATGEPVAFVISGLPPSEFDEGITSSIAERLYLLDDGGPVVGILVYDLSGGGHLSDYDTVVASLRFGPG